MCGGWFWTSEACVGIECPVMLSPPSALPPPTVPPAPQTTRKTEKLPGRCQEPKRKLVKCRPLHMPGPFVTNLGDTIEEAMRKPPSNWQEWLRKNKLWDEGMDECVAFMHYYNFHKVIFDAIPQEQWPTYYHRLADMEDLFVVGHAIGEVPGQPFCFKVMDKTPICLKLRAYPPA